MIWTLILGGVYLYVTWNGDIDVEAEIDEALRKELNL